MTHPKVLVVDDDPVVLESLTEGLKLEGYQVVGTNGGRSAIKHLDRQDFRAAVLDVSLPDISGLAVLSYIREHVPFLPVVMITGFGNVRDAVQAGQGWCVGLPPQAGVDGTVESSAQGVGQIKTSGRRTERTDES